MRSVFFVLFLAFFAFVTMVWGLRGLLGFSDGCYFGVVLSGYTCPVVDDLAFGGSFWVRFLGAVGLLVDYLSVRDWIEQKIAFFSHFGVLGVFIVQFSSFAVLYVGPRYTGHLLFDTLFLLSSPVSTLAVGRPISPSWWKRTTLFFVGMGVLHCMVCYFFCLVKS